MRFKDKLRSILLASGMLLITLNTCSKKAQQASEQIAYPAYNILIGDEGRKLVDHCTDIFKTGVNGYWEPSGNKIYELERLLIPFLNAQNIKSINLASYVRQYTGVIKGDRSIIFVNGVHSSIMKAMTKGQDVSKDAIVLCDGGNLVYGVEFDVETKRFQKFTLNPDR